MGNIPMGTHEIKKIIFPTLFTTSSPRIPVKYINKLLYRIAIKENYMPYTKYSKQTNKEALAWKTSET